MAAARVHDVGSHRGQVLGARGEHRDPDAAGAQRRRLAEQRPGDQAAGRGVLQPLGGPGRPAGHQAWPWAQGRRPRPGQAWARDLQRRGRAHATVHASGGRRLVRPASYQPGMEQDATCTASASGTRGGARSARTSPGGRCRSPRRRSRSGRRPGTRRPAAPARGHPGGGPRGYPGPRPWRAGPRAVPRPRGSQALAPTPGWISAPGRAALVSISRGEPACRCGRGGCGPSSRSRRPAVAERGHRAPRRAAGRSSRPG